LNKRVRYDNHNKNTKAAFRSYAETTKVTLCSNKINETTPNDNTSNTLQSHPTDANKDDMILSQTVATLQNDIKSLQSSIDQLHQKVHETNKNTANDITSLEQRCNKQIEQLHHETQSSIQELGK
jgi:predicted  nucleic acid-binding Zn-ribbon protein